MDTGRSTREALGRTPGDPQWCPKRACPIRVLPYGAAKQMLMLTLFEESIYGMVRQHR